MAQARQTPVKKKNKSVKKERNITDTVIKAAIKEEQKVHENYRREIYRLNKPKRKIMKDLEDPSEMEKPETNREHQERIDKENKKVR